LSFDRGRLATCRLDAGMRDYRTLKVGRHA
jgi:hypothetical protein